MSELQTQSKRLVENARAWLRERWRDFRKHSTSFQYKAYIGGAYVFLVVVTIIAVVPRSPSNRLDAHVLAARADFVAGSFIMVRNDSSRDWKDVTLTLNGTHVYRPPNVRSGEKVRVELKAFTAPGQRPLTESEARVLDIKTARGSERYALSFLVN